MRDLFRKGLIYSIKRVKENSLLTILFHSLSFLEVPGELASVTDSYCISENFCYIFTTNIGSIDNYLIINIL